ncbi:hypothetical protein [Pedobacter nanyangensis]|uniref:hypothetical protein n=1 Tax=Pedobacter nanyangensis TaxID=1562389 RepID=UPI000DE552EF|nr:hypothetical protein [Pedobacter nanyangensis]
MKTNQLIILAIASEQARPKSSIQRIINKLPRYQFLISANYQAGSLTNRLWAVLKAVWMK